MITLAQAIDRFCEHVRLERGLADHTVKAYSADLQSLLAYLSKDDTQPVALSELTPLYVKDFVAHLRDDRALRPSSIGRMLSSLRVFFDYCVGEQWIATSPAATIRNPRMAKKLPVYLVEDEIARLLRDGIEPGENAARDRAILITFVFTGLRLAELVGLDEASADFSANCLRVFGKGSKERLIPMHKGVRDALHALANASPPCGGPFFRDRDGNRMTPRMVGYVVQQAIVRAGLSQRITPHKLRHTFATQLLHRGASLLEIKELLGHSRIATTSIYTHTHVDRLRKAVDALDA